MGSDSRDPLETAQEAEAAHAGVVRQDFKTEGSLGSYPKVSPEMARAKAYECLDRAKRGVPVSDESVLVATASRLTVAELADRFLSDYVHLKELRAARKYEMAIRDNRYGYVKEMRAVLERWSTELTVDESNTGNIPIGCALDNDP